MRVVVFREIARDLRLTLHCAAISPTDKCERFQIWEPVQPPGGIISRPPVPNTEISENAGSRNAVVALTSTALV